MSRYLTRLEEEATTSDRLTVADLELVRTELLQEINRTGSGKNIQKKSPSTRRFSYASPRFLTSARFTNPKVVSVQEFLVYQSIPYCLILTSPPFDIKNLDQYLIDNNTFYHSYGWVIVILLVLRRETIVISLHNYLLWVITLLINIVITCNFCSRE